MVFLIHARFWKRVQFPGEEFKIESGIDEGTKIQGL
jgi:hypothetical protein